MRIVYERPPLFELIDAKFHVAGKPVIFSWGDRIYNPERIEIGPGLMAHEAVHGERQRTADIDLWWRQYLASPYFRLQEELPAHRAELRVLLGDATNRHERRAHVKSVVSRLSGPLYGGLITPAKARAALLSA